jgi:arabinoxylan arabinofuranohydrolase
MTTSQLLLATTVLATACILPVDAQVPIIQTVHTGDPAPMLHDGKVYLYVGHDEDTAPDNRFVMHEFLCFSTSDMVNWTDHGSVLRVKDIFKWSGGFANASHVIERNGKFYLYAEVGVGIGVAVADSPTGPFRDALGHPLVRGSETKAKHGHDDLDPCVFINEEGRAFMYWGNNACYFAELNDDMISLKGPIQSLPLTPEIFGPDYEEAPWVYKRNGVYHMLYASHIPEMFRYATSPSPTGPWTYAGEVMDRQETNGSNHPGLIEYKGQPYLFYQTDSLPAGCDHRRSICVEPFEYNKDGTLPKIARGAGVVEPAGSIDPFQRVEAETIAWAQGVRTAKDPAVGIHVTDIDRADYIKIRNVDFGSRSPRTFQASVASDKVGGSIDVRLGSPYGRRLATLKVGETGGLQTWQTVSCPVRAVTGLQDLYLVFNTLADAGFNIDWWKFE